ncbi:signal peptidase I [Conexibacter sp. SYSU D00693]|uniref:signal peptidase I n=1 Tax=Conexibacter sp. SYSU D00693 TaxID=2812560 RepID=UPI00196A39F8|nr:signal peptidase I [Conexibacter sp. SYSU D00693]
MSRKKGGEGSTGNSLVELVVIVVVALGLALGIQAFLVKPYRIPSESMVPTLDVGQRVLVNRISKKLGGDPSVGDIVVFHPPAGSETNTCGDPTHPEDQACPRPTNDRSDVNFIKRVVGGPGDTIAIRGGRVIRNGRPTDEPFIRACGGGSGCDFPRPIKVPAGHFFMMGDNRGESDDSRFWGPVPSKWIIGGAFATYWPIDKIGLL